MYKRRPLNHLNNWHSYARLFAERLRCAYYVVHTITTAIVLKMQSTSAHVSFECMLFQLSQDDMERTHRKRQMLLHSELFVYMIHYSHWSFTLDKSSKAIFFHLASRENISTEWMNDMWSYSTMTSASWESSNVERAWPSMGHWTSKDAYLSSSTARMADSKCYI